jgi:hypothetical protein
MESRTALGKLRRRWSKQRPLVRQGAPGSKVLEHLRKQRLIREAAGHGELDTAHADETDRQLAVCDPTWQDVDWDANRIVVQSPKTKHHVGKASRTIPLFAELRPTLDVAFELASKGAVYVVDGSHREAANTAAAGGTVTYERNSSGWFNAQVRRRGPDCSTPCGRTGFQH